MQIEPLASTHIFPSASLADPLGSSPLLAAGAWAEAALLGTFATLLAVIGVAGLGMMMLSGRLHARRGAAVVFGCFILFGAPRIANGLMSALAVGGDASGPDVPQSAVAVTAPPPPPRVGGYDPYAGAAVPMRR